MLCRRLVAVRLSGAQQRRPRLPVARALFASMAGPERDEPSPVPKNRGKPADVARVEMLPTHDAARDHGGACKSVVLAPGRAWCTLSGSDTAPNDTVTPLPQRISWSAPVPEASSGKRKPTYRTLPSDVTKRAGLIASRFTSQRNDRDYRWRHRHQRDTMITFCGRDCPLSDAQPAAPSAVCGCPERIPGSSAPSSAGVEFVTPQPGQTVSVSPVSTGFPVPPAPTARRNPESSSNWDVGRLYCYVGRAGIVPGRLGQSHTGRRRRLV
jgi:hypothetical protein